MDPKSIGTTAAANALSRRNVLLSAAGLAAAGVVGSSAGAAQAAPTTTGLAAGSLGSAGSLAGKAATLGKIARDRGIVFGSSTATWQISDAEYSALFAKQADILFTEDDLLWYQLKPTPKAPLNFKTGDEIIAYAERNRQLVLAAHLVWDEGFGEGWPEDYLWNLDRAAAEELLFSTARAMVRRYRGRVAGWIVANEVTSPIGDGGDDLGFRTEVPWYQTIGRDYVARMFRLARRHDRHATLVLNEFGFETTNEYDDDPVARQEAFLKVIDTLQRSRVPLDAVGIQAHLLANYFDSFNPRQYRGFLKKLADRDLAILITELDVLDDGLPAAVGPRDRGVADVYARYLDTALSVPAVKSLITFGLSDRYTWLQEDYPREDGADRRPLPYDDELQPKPAYRALRRELVEARRRRPLWRCRRRS